MLSSSVRRAAYSAQPSQILSCILPYSRSHQRRASSSKPSSPADGSKGVTEGQTVPAESAKAGSDGNKKPAARPSRRKSKDIAASSAVKERDEAMPNLPSVPNTHHVKGKEIAAATFFSLHRPISVTTSFPKTVTDEAFAAIFTSRTRANARPSDVMSSLANTVDKLERATQQERWNAETDELRLAITAESNQAEGEVRHLDQSPPDSLIPFPQHVLSGDYRPFNPPGPPQPLNSAESLAAGAEAAASTPPPPHHRTYKAVLTISESTDAHGAVTYMAHSSPLIAEIEDSPSNPSPDMGSPRPSRLPMNYRERMQVRQERYGESLERRGGDDAAVWAISVKRQRKLKMKKHKYKKLMRRTRNLRRRLDRN